jgi:hypothetical protein
MPTILLVVLGLGLGRRFLSADNGPDATASAFNGFNTALERFMDPYRPLIVTKARRAAPTPQTAATTTPTQPAGTATETAVPVTGPSPAGEAARNRLAGLTPASTPAPPQTPQTPPRVDRKTSGR